MGATESGFTAYRSINHHPGRNTVQLPNIGSTGKPTIGNSTTPIAKTLEGFLVYPNPAKDQINISVATPKTATVITAQVYSYTGKILQQQKQSIVTNTTQRQNVLMNISNLSSGLYTVVLLDDKGNTLGNAKFIKTKE